MCRSQPFGLVPKSTPPSPEQEPLHLAGLAISRGSFITVVQDNVWLPPSFVERTLAFYTTHGRDALLSYPERRISAPAGRLSKDMMASHTVPSLPMPRASLSTS